MKKIILMLAIAGMFACKTVSAQENIAQETKKLTKVKITQQEIVDNQNNYKPIIFGAVEEDEIYSLSNFPESARNSTLSVEVITSDEIDKSKVITLKDLLKLYSGVVTRDQGSYGDLASFRVRGWDKVSLLIDGVRIDNPSYGNSNLSHILAEDIDRVEIIKGPQGTMHGNKAQGGLISITTKKGFGAPKINFESGMGTYSTFKESFSLSGGDNSADYYLGITRLDTNGGMKTTDEGDVKRDAYSNLTLSSNLGKRLFKGTAEVRNVFKYIESKKQIGLSEDWFGDTLFDPNALAQYTDIVESLTLNHSPANWYNYDLKLGYYGFNYDSADYSDSFNDLSNQFNRVKNNRLMFSTQHNLKYKDINTFSAGYNLEYNNFKQNSVDDDPFWGANDRFVKNFLTNDVFLNDTINIKDTLILKSGVRISDSDWGTYATPNLSGALILPTYGIANSYTKLRSSYGTSINNPTAYQLAGLYAGFALGNPNLRPERCQGWDVGVVQSFLNDRANIEFNYFDNNFNNLIAWDSVASTYNNIDRAQTSGFESIIKLNLLSGLKLMANYTYTNNNGKNNEDINGIPRNKYGFSLSYEPSDLYNVYARFVTASSISYSGTNRVNGFFDTGIGGAFRLLKFKTGNLYAWAQLNNLLNDRYELYRGYRHPGIHFLAGIQFKYNLPVKEKL